MNLKDVLDILMYPKHAVSRQARRQAIRSIARLLLQARLSFFDFIRIWWEYRKFLK
jgi:hypothetical protein